MYNYSNILPDPNYGRDRAGLPSAAQNLGQPFRKVELNFSHQFEQNNTLVGKTVRRTNKFPEWLINITYNPMTREQFLPVYNFIMSKNLSRDSFRIILPQYALPKDSNFATFVNTRSLTFAFDPIAGATQAEITTPDWIGNNYNGLPKVGDIFNVADPKDSLHTKAYMVTAVETWNDYVTANRPTSGNIRLYFSPGLQRVPQPGAELRFIDPMFTVTLAADVFEYKLDTEDLYEFGLKLREAQY